MVFVDHDPARLAGAADAHHRIEGVALVPVREPVHAGPYVRIEAVGPPGAEQPPAWPPSPRPAAACG